MEASVPARPVAGFARLVNGLQQDLLQIVAIAPVADQRGAVASPTAVIEKHLDRRILPELRMGCAEELALLAAATADGQNKQR